MRSYEGFSRLKTKEARTHYKVELLRKYWSLKKRKPYISHIINLSYHLKGENLNENQLGLLHQINGLYQSTI